MLVEIITIGDEILIGQITDTNSTWMAAQLTKQGFEVVAISSVADQKDSITKAIDIAFSRADILLLTGGIGPTKDDITKNTLCSYFNTDLIFDEAVLQNINEIFWRRKYTLNELTRSQAMVPRGSTVIQNRAGTAPIIWFEKNDKILVSMPGVPSEMKTAMRNDILPKLVNQFNVDNYMCTTLSVSGITESDLAIKLNDFENKLPDYTNLAYLPAYGIIRLRLSLRNRRNGDNLNELTNELKQLVKPFLIDDEDRPIEMLLGILLNEKKLTISTAESCTGGRVSQRITKIAGASNYYKGSIVSYSNEAKINLLGVNSQTLDKHGAVSKQVVEQMAISCCKQLNTDCSIAISGIAGPSGGTDDKPVGTTWICTKYGDKILTKLYQFVSAREINIERATNAGILQIIGMIRE